MTVMFRSEPLHLNATVEHACLALAASHREFFWLDSAAAQTPGVSYFGVAATTHLAQPGHEAQFLDTIRAELRRRQTEANAFDFTGDELSEGSSFDVGGAMCAFSYEFGVRLLGLDSEVATDMPYAVAMIPAAVFAYHHDRDELRVFAPSKDIADAALAELDQALAEHLAAVSELCHRAETISRSVHEQLQRMTETEAASQQAASSDTHLQWRDSREQYLANISRIKASIAAGDSYLACLTSELRLPRPASELLSYAVLRRVSGAPYSGLLRVEDVVLLSTSPEQFLNVDRNRLATTSPIKGTRPRLPVPADDQALAEELAHDPKERAENLMIVDLMRNDFSEVCQPGTVTVSELHRVRSYTHVHQLVSRITGKLRADADAITLFEHCFPAGSMTGAPKHRTVQLLAELERAPRGLYSGCFGYFAADGCADLAMTIRSAVLAGDHALIGAGGGITQDSAPDDEVAEVLVKARALRAVIEATARG